MDAVGLETYFDLKPTIKINDARLFFMDKFGFVLVLFYTISAVFYEQQYMQFLPVTPVGGAAAEPNEAQSRSIIMQWQQLLLLCALFCLECSSCISFLSLSGRSLRGARYTLLSNLMPSRHVASRQIPTARPTPAYAGRSGR